jgi:hypothetical protein
MPITIIEAQDAPTADLDLVCAECGDRTATTYVVTILDHADPNRTRTEVCMPCHEVISCS